MATEEQIAALARKWAQLDGRTWDRMTDYRQEDYVHEARKHAAAIDILCPIVPIVPIVPTCGDCCPCGQCSPCRLVPDHEGNHNDGACTWRREPAPEAPAVAVTPDFLALVQCPCPRHDGKAPAPEAPAAEAPLCLKSSGGTRCMRASGHDGRHETHGGFWWLDELSCGHAWEGNVCTRPLGHAGPHAASDGAMWSPGACPASALAQGAAGEGGR